MVNAISESAIRMEISIRNIEIILSNSKEIDLIP